RRVCKHLPSSRFGNNIKVPRDRIGSIRFRRTIFIQTGEQQMSKQEEANLILKLYELRREPVMREARNWFFSFNPTSAAEYMEAMMGEHSGHLRMVISYWDMAASLVNNGAIHEKI